MERLKVAAFNVLQGQPKKDEVLLWLPILLNLDPAAAVDFMERSATSISPAPHSEVTDWIAEVFGRRGRRNKVDLAALESYPLLLLRLARLAYQHIRFDDDIRHSGVYSPGIRDDAQRARSEISNALLNCKGAEAWAAKLEFSDKNP